MDYSNEFCEMCMLSTELQKLSHSVHTSKVFITKQDDGTYVSAKHLINSSTFWLPSETQLEKLMGAENQDYFFFLKNPYHQAIQTLPLNIFKSFEQYRLAFLMKKTYNKIWSSKKWLMVTDNTLTY